MECPENRRSGAGRGPAAYDWRDLTQSPTGRLKGSLAGALLAAAAALVLAASPAQAAVCHRAAADHSLKAAMRAFVHSDGGPPGISAVIQRGGHRMLFTAGYADLADRAPIIGSDHMRLASVSKAFSGAVALSLVAAGTLHLDDTVGRWLPHLSPLWSAVTLRELLQHTSGIPDFSKSDAFKEALGDSLLASPPPEALVSYVADEALEFTPGTRYHYSNSDNIIVGLMVQAATHRSYENELQRLVFGPLRLRHTSLPSGERIPSPSMRGYNVAPPKAPEDFTELFAAGWTWASGGIVSSPDDANAFVRAYARGSLTNHATRAAQMHFVPGSSEPTGAGVNAAGLGIFRYRTRCGTVYGHTGNTAGYTQFVAASANGSRSAVVSINAQITPTVSPLKFPALRRIYTLAVCAALAR